MFVPYSLRKTEQAILDELRKSNLAVIFSITNYNVDNSVIEYVLVSVSGSEDVPLQAKRIAQKNLDKWKSTFVTCRR